MFLGQTLKPGDLLNVNFNYFKEEIFVYYDPADEYLDIELQPISLLKKEFCCLICLEECTKLEYDKYHYYGLLSTTTEEVLLVIFSKDHILQ